MSVNPPNYTQVPNELLGDILKGNITQPGLLAEMGLAELKVVLAVCRLTFGYHQDERRASLSTLQKLTGLSRQGVLDGAEEAEGHGFIERAQDGGVTLWRILVKLVDQEEVVKPVDQVVKPVDQTGQASRPPSKKETRKIPEKETKKETHGASAQDDDKSLSLNLDGNRRVLKAKLDACVFHPQGQRGPGRFPTTNAAEKFDAAAGRLNSNLASAIDAALEQGCTSLIRVVNYIAKYETRKETQHAPHRRPSQNAGSDLSNDPGIAEQQRLVRAALARRSP